MYPAIYGINVGIPGGFSQITMGLVEGLRELRVDHSLVDLQLRPAQGQERYREPVGADVVGPSLRWTPIAVERALRLGILGWQVQFKRSPTLYHLTNQLLARTIKKRPLILTLDNLAPLEESSSNDSSWVQRSLYQSILRVAREQADAIICPTEFMKRSAIGWGLRESKLHVINYSISLRDLVRFNSAELREGLPHTRILLSVGGEMGRKRIDLQLRTIAELDDWTLVRVLPEGQPSPTSKKLIDDLSIHDKVKYLAPPRGASRAYTLALYKACDAVIHTAEYGSFEFVPVEASALGTPVICPRLDPMKELLEGVIFVDDYQNPKALSEGVWRSCGWDTSTASRRALTYVGSRQARETLTLYRNYDSTNANN